MGQESYLTIESYNNAMETHRQHMANNVLRLDEAYINNFSVKNVRHHDSSWLEIEVDWHGQEGTVLMLHKLGDKHKVFPSDAIAYEETEGDICLGTFKNNELVKYLDTEVELHKSYVYCAIICYYSTFEYYKYFDANDMSKHEKRKKTYEAQICTEVRRESVRRVETPHEYHERRQRMLALKEAEARAAVESQFESTDALQAAFDSAKAFAESVHQTETFDEEFDRFCAEKLSFTPTLEQREMIHSYVYQAFKNNLEEQQRGT